MKELKNRINYVLANNKLDTIKTIFIKKHNPLKNHNEITTALKCEL